MSIEVILKALVGKGALKIWLPKLDGDETIHRHLYMRPDLHTWVETKGASYSQRVYFASVRQFLKDFVVGENFDNPNKLKNLDVDHLKQADQGYYAFRQQRFDPKARIFGGFADANIFIATHRELRDSELSPNLGDGRGQAAAV